MNTDGYFEENTLVVMSDLTLKPIKDIVVGDMIVGDDSTLRIVLEVKRDVCTMYMLCPVQGKGDGIICDENQMLSLKCRDYRFGSGNKLEGRYRANWINSEFETKSRRFSVKSKEHPKGNYESIEAAEKAVEALFASQPSMKDEIFCTTLKDYLSRSSRWRENFCLYNVPVTFDYTPVEIDPYIVGYWLGDGTTVEPSITTENPEVVAYFNAYATSIGHVLTARKQQVDNASTTYRIRSTTSGHGKNKFLNSLRNYNLIGNKHIPPEYKYNSRDVQLKLLAGIIDSDGYCNGGTCYDICLKLENLVSDIADLCITLGYTINRATVEKTCTNSRNGRVTGTYYRMSVTSNDFSDLPLLLNYKRARDRVYKIDSLSRSFDVAGYGGDINGIKLELDGNKKFLLKDFVVAHC